ncbi:hypothetical protein MRX96_009907 [Rhipicephalus microplus]
MALLAVPATLAVGFVYLDKAYNKHRSDVEVEFDTPDEQFRHHFRLIFPNIGKAESIAVGIENNVLTINGFNAKKDVAQTTPWPTQQIARALAAKGPVYRAATCPN